MKLDRRVFLDEYRARFDNTLTEEEILNIDIFLNFFESDFCKFEIYEWAYIFATVYHETAHTFKPVIEAFWKSDNWRRDNLRYYPYYGRGYVQLTWKKNYELFSDIIGVDMIKNPEVACDPKVAWDIMIIGCKRGLFTGAPIGRYIKYGKPDYVNMRRVINGTDKAILISEYATGFSDILKKCIKQ